MARYIILSLFLLFSVKIFSQELNCNVTIHHQQIQATEKRVYDNMREGVMEFMKNKTWTEDKFEPFEKIECNYYIKIDDRKSADRFSGSVQVQAVRPIYGTNYNSPMINLLDESFVFDYVEFQTIDFSEGAFTSNLSSVLAFYAYIILGLDYDSYSKYGGTTYFQKALEIANKAQGTEFTGWDNFSTDKDNRYWLAYQLTYTTYKPLREALYMYHRLGLDKMTDDPETSRHTITEALMKLKKVYRDDPNSFLLKQFLSAKRDEIIKIYTEATSTEIDEILQLMKEIDGANYGKYSDKLKAK